MITLTENDNSRHISVKKNETLQLTLPCNPSTGYFWQTADTSCGELLETKWKPSTKPGSPTDVTFVFRIAKDGPLMLCYDRPWSEAEPAKWYNVSVKAV